MYRVEYPMVCRLCLLQSDFCINIFSPHGNSGLLVWRIIGDIIDTEVSQEDGLPPTICTVCMGKLVDFQHFRSMCIESRVEWLKRQAIQGMVVPIKREVDLSDDQLDQTQSFNDEEYTGKDPLDSADDDSNSLVPNESSTVNSDGWQDWNVQEGNSNNHNIPGSGTLECRSATPQCMEETRDSDSSGMKNRFCSLSRNNQLKLEEEDAASLESVTSGNGVETRAETSREKLNFGERLLEVSFENAIRRNQDETSMDKCSCDIHDSKIMVEVSRTSSSGQDKVEEWKELEKMKDATTSSDPVKLHVIENSVPLRYTCNECNERFVEEEHLRSHVQSSHLDKLEFSCELCGKAFAQKSVLLTHINSHNSTKPHECSECGKRLDSLHSLREHVVMHSEKRGYTCDNCLETFAQKSRLGRHLASSKGSYACKICSMSFGQECGLTMHGSEHASVKEHSCSVCSKGFGSKTDLRRHMLIHSGEKPFECPVCCTKFNDPSNLKRHMRTHPDEKPYPCRFCSNSFTRASLLREHMAMHNKGNAFSCAVCSKTFPYPSHLRRHLAIVHERRKPHSCTICSEEFSVRSDLLKHLITVHEGKKCHSCTVCSKVFPRRRSLRSHMVAVHEGTRRPHPCTICSQAFNSKSNLDTHMMVHSGLKPFVCAHCPYKSNRKHNLKMHVLTTHKDAEDVS